MKEYRKKTFKDYILILSDFINWIVKIDKLFSITSSWKINLFSYSLSKKVLI